jgi:flagellin
MLERAQSGKLKAQRKEKNNNQGGFIMSLRIQNNIAALNAHRQLQISDTGLSKSLERLSSGYRINRAADDAAGLAISQQFRADIASYKVASRNTSEASSLLQVAEGALDQIGNMLTRLKELATQAASANAGDNRTKLNAEGNALIAEIDRIATSTEYANTKLINGTFGVGISAGSTALPSLGVASASGMEAGAEYDITTAAGTDSGVKITVSAASGTQVVDNVAAPDSGDTVSVSFGDFGLDVTFNSNLSATSLAGEFIEGTASGSSTFQVGAENEANNRIDVSIGDATTTALGLTADQLDTASEAQAFLGDVDNAISTLVKRRGDIGAIQNRLQYSSSNLSVTIENVQAAESVIRDVDMAAEMTTFTKNQILLQAGTAMLAQANMAPQVVLSLFGG